MLKYRCIGITVKSGLSYKHEAVEKILAILRNLDAEVRIDPKRIENIEDAKDLQPYASEDEIDLLLVIGGDGTILRAVRELQNFHTPILSVNRGTLGFLAEIDLDEAEELIPKLLNDQGILEERNVLHVEAFRGEEKLFDGYALNEAVIAQGTIARLVELKATINGEKLTSFHADGLIVATPTGSTAYSLAAGGPIVYPTLQATILTPINPHSFSQKPVLVPSTHVIDLQVGTKQSKFQDTNVVLTIDGQISVHLQDGDHVQVCGCENTVKFLRRKQDTFFATLRKKLRWGERLEE